MIYNGWTNYETWAVGMFLDGNYTGEGTYREVLEIISDHAERGSYELATALQEFVEEDPSVTAVQERASIAADLLGAALSEVNWDELATSRLDDYKSEHGEEDAETDD